MPVTLFPITSEGRKCPLSVIIFFNSLSCLYIICCDFRNIIQIKLDSLIGPGVFSYYICVIFATLPENLENQSSSVDENPSNS